MSLPAGVHALAQPYGEDGVPIYPVAVETADGVILVDVGVPDNLDQLEADLAEFGATLEDVERVVVTHHDFDHTGALSDVVDRSGADVVTHVDEMAYVEGDEDLMKGGNAVYDPVPVDIGVTAGVRFRTEAGPMVVVETPGHTPGHISVYFPDERFLVSADALTADERLRGPSEEFTPDMQLATESVGQLSELDVERTLCYHGGLVDAGTARIEDVYGDLSTA